MHFPCFSPNFIWGRLSAVGSLPEAQIILVARAASFFCNQAL